VYKVIVEIHLCSLVKYDYQWADFHKIHLALHFFCKELQHQISCQSDNILSYWYHVTDGQTCMVSKFGVVKMAQTE
jgi:hypothetical protein